MFESDDGRTRYPPGWGLILAVVLSLFMWAVILAPFF